VWAVGSMLGAWIEEEEILVATAGKQISLCLLLAFSVRGGCWTRRFGRLSGGAWIAAWCFETPSTDSSKPEDILDALQVFDVVVKQ